MLALDEARRSVKPLELRSSEEPGRWLADATVAYQGALFVCSVVGPL